MRTATLTNETSLPSIRILNFLDGASRVSSDLEQQVMGATGTVAVLYDCGNETSKCATIDGQLLQTGDVCHCSIS
jgi:hypothetical protein